MCWLRRPAGTTHQCLRRNALLMGMHLSRATYRRSDSVKGLLPPQTVTDERAGTRAVVGGGTPTRTSAITARNCEIAAN